MTNANHVQMIMQACRDVVGTAPPEHKILSRVGKWLRWQDANDKGRATSCGVLLHDHGTHFVYVIMNHRAGIKKTGSTRSGKSQRMTPEERRLAAQQRAEMEQRRIERSARKRRMLSAMVRKLWGAALKPEYWQGVHPYLLKKKIPPLNCRRYISKKRDVLMIPLIDLASGQLVTCQIIYGNSFKRLIKGSEMNGLCAGISSTGATIAESPVLWLAEGYASAVSLSVETGEPVVMTVSASNMIHVADALAQRYEGKVIKVMADDDKLTQKKTGRNPGILAAQQVQKRHPSISLHRPLWPPGAPESLSDINDLVLWESQQNGGVS